MWIAISTLNALCQDNTELSDGYRKTKISIDSLQNELDNYRNLLGKDKTKDAEYSAKIISIEDSLYELNSKLNKLGALLIQSDPNALDKIAKETQSQFAASAQVRNILNHKFLRENISVKDLTLIDGARIAESKIMTLSDKISVNYAKLEQVKSRYALTLDPTELDSLLHLAKELKEQIKSYDNTISELWKELYDKKSNLYPEITAKLEDVDRIQIEEIDSYRRNVRRAESLSQALEAPSVANYNVQKELLLHYEMMFADNLGQKLATDSLNSELKKIKKIELQTIDFQPRSLVVYSKAVIDGAYGTSSVDSIPQAVIPGTGIYYSIQVAIFTNKPTSLDIFRKARPLRVKRMTNGMYQYLVGGFKTYAEAIASLTVMQKNGYRSLPIMVAWNNGVVTTPAKAKLAEDAITKANAGKFRIEITTQNSMLITNLRQIVDDMSSGKQITRSQLGENTVVFTVMQFNNQLEAESITEILGAYEKTKIEILKQNQ